MLNLKTCDYSDVARFGGELYDYYMGNAHSFEEVAQGCAEDIFSTFKTGNGHPMFALVRIFRYSPHSELLEELLPLVNPQTSACFALMGTVGVEQDWCDRTRSHVHQIICAQTASSMFQTAMQLFDFDWPTPISQTTTHMPENVWDLYTCYEAHAPDSIPMANQRRFGTPYGIQSVLGVGGQLASDTGVLMVAFSTVALDNDDIEKFEELTPFVMTALANYNHPETLWR